MNSKLHLYYRRHLAAKNNVIINLTPIREALKKELKTNQEIVISVHKSRLVINNHEFTISFPTQEELQQLWALHFLEELDEFFTSEGFAFAMDCSVETDIDGDINNLNNYSAIYEKN